MLERPVPFTAVHSTLRKRVFTKGPGKVIRHMRRVNSSENKLEKELQHIFLLTTL